MSTVIIALLLLAACAAIAFQVSTWRGERRPAHYGPPPLIIPVTEPPSAEAFAPTVAVEPIVERPAEPIVERAAEPIIERAPELIVERTIEPIIERGSPAVIPLFTTPLAERIPDTGATVDIRRPSPDEEFAPPDPLTLETLQVRHPSNDAIQLLPARLEVIEGASTKQEIRFVRFPGGTPQLILGREAAQSPQHVSLSSPTVSRRHARVAFDGGRWTVTNLSRTNPVIVNDETLPDLHSERAIADGDRIELGDVVLRFRAS